MPRRPRIPVRRPPVVKSGSANSPELVKLLQEGLALHHQGKLGDAKQIYEKILQKQSNHFVALQLLGTIYTQVKQHEVSLQYFDKALQINKTNSEVFNNRGIVLQNLKRLDEALTSYEEALRINPDYAEALNNRGIVLQNLKRLDEALTSYEEALHIKPDYAKALNNRGIVLKDLKRLDEALTSYEEALRINPDYAEALNNQGNALRDLKRLDEALTSYEEALRIKPDYAKAFYNRGNALRGLKRLDEALTSYEEALRIKPDYEFLPGICQYTRMHLCVWTNFQETVEELRRGIASRLPISSPFPVLGLIDDLETQRLCATTYVETKHSKSILRYSNQSQDLKEKPKIGYFSADFHNHATLHLMQEVFKNHDHSRFDFFAFSFGPQTNDSWQQEAKTYFKDFIDVRDKSDAQVAELSRQLGIDIAIDLKGFTADARTGIFANRAAPTQINYLGYPGTMGADYIDYIIADKIVIPEESQQFYTEKVLYLPNCYQSNIRTRKVSEKEISRKDVGLPEDVTIYCSFNNIYKITPDMFSIWLEILKSVESSVLWILCTSDTAKHNLIQFANSHGVDSSRIVFAPHMPIEEHLKRLLLADVFLDTFPCNAHTTASDAVRMGVPIVTLAGESFASRVAASILSTIGMQELIVNNPEDYKSLAIRLGADTDYLKTVKHELKMNLSESSLFDSVTFTKDLENIYESLIS